jgi:superfamily I DNA/RNA helicase
MLQCTLEQENIIYSEEKHVYVSARAGTGKTTTLVEFVKVRKSVSFLYIVYNNAIRVEALNKFPERVDIHTIHSLAFEKFGYKYKDKLKNNLKIEDIFIEDYFKDKDLSDKKYQKEAFTILKIINNYCNSEISNFEDISDLKELRDIAYSYWLKMIDIDNKEVKITHDGYLKLYQLEKPQLNYDFIMVDEAQDSNEVMLHIIFNQINSNKIFVGDPHQKIYGFRGALNIFQNQKYLSLEEKNGFYSLTESFRFGEEISFIANSLLKNYKNEINLIKGTKDRNSFVGEIDKSINYTIITRTNAKLIDIAIESVIANKKIHIVGGFNYIKNSILDAYYIYTNQFSKIKNDYMKTFNSFNHLKIMAKTLKNSEQSLQVYLIEKYGKSLYEYFEMIDKNLTGINNSDLILTTAHKSKGLEFVSVKIAEDFIDLYSENGILLDLVEPEEINLLYVAITRATYDLELNSDLEKFIQGIKNGLF